MSLMLVDFDSLDSVRTFAADFKHQHDRLHVLINNAGVYRSEREESKDGYERTFQINHLAPFLLTNLLLDRLRESAPARIVNVSSGAERQGVMDFDDLHGAMKYSGVKAYCQSKLANVLFAYELARRMEGSDVAANSLEPGVVRTNFARDASGFFALMVKVSRPFMLSPKKGAEAVVHLASSPEVEDVSGQHFAKKEVRKSLTDSYDRDSAVRLWQVSEELTGLNQEA